MWIQLVQISMIFSVTYFLGVGGGGGWREQEFWWGKKEQSVCACPAMISHMAPSLPPNSVLYLPPAGPQKDFSALIPANPVLFH